MEKGHKIYVAGHNGMIGSAICRKLENLGYHNIIVRDLTDLDLRNQHEVTTFFEKEKPDYVFLAAAKVGGIHANNTFRADFIFDNIMIQSNIVHSSYENDVKKLLFLGSSCIYPKTATQPMKETDLLTGTLEPTNEPYAIAKIAGIKMCEAYRIQYGCDFISTLPTNSYGPNDNYDLDNSHVLPALIKKFHDAKSTGQKEVYIWGSGKPLREFIHADDLADGCIFLMNNYSENEPVNLGTGVEVSILELAELIKDIVGFEGEIKFDASKPDGMLRKLLDTSKINGMGWDHKIGLKDGIRATYKLYCKQLLT